MNYRNFILLLIFTFFLFVSSCKKKDASSLAGDWDYIYMEQPTDVEKQVWSFDGNSDVEINIFKSDTTITYKGHYTYYYKSMSKDLLDIYDLNDKYESDGKYKIHKFKNGNLVIERIELTNGNEDGAFLWKEFTKK